ncbi:MAG: AgmX/PglI C-terminal domain-containing protein, partial [Myxococcota bacterium]
ADAGLAGYEWYVAIDGQQHGPFAFAELVSKVERGDVVGRHYVWHDGMSDWTRVRDMPDLATYLEQNVSPPPEPPAEVGGDVVAFDGEAAADPGATEADVEVPAEVAAAMSAVPAAAEGTEVEARAEAANGVDGSGAAVATGTVPEGVHLDLELGDEDLFAKIPRATNQELVQRESTKFFVAAAGVKNEKKKNRLGIIFAGIAAVLFAAFMGLWAGGIIHVSLPGLGNPFRGPSETTAVVHDTTGAEGGDLSFLAEGVKVGTAKVRKVRRRRSRKGAGGAEAGSPSSPLDRLGRGDYVDSVDDGDEFARDRARGESAGIESAKVDLEGGRRIEPSGLPEGLDPSSNPLIPPPDVEELDAKTIKAVVSTKKASVRLCYERSLKAQENLEGKLQIGLVVASNGRVQSTEILSPSFRGTVVGSCIRNTIRNWRFPAFAGGDQEIELPFVFQRGS